MRIHPAIPGAIAWLAATIALKLGVVESLFLWAPLVVIPLGLEAIPAPRGIRLIQPFAAGFAALSFAFPPGMTAAAFAAPWALVTAAMALVGASRFFRRRPFDFVETCVDAALGMIVVGGWGLVMSRAGMKPAGFEEPIVLLTAVHFHYTAFAAPLLVGLAGRWAGPSLSIRIAGAAVVLSTPILAMGFTLRLPFLKVVAALAIAAGLAIFAGRLVRIATNEPRGLPRLFLGLASFSIFWGMALVATYSIGEYREQLAANSISTMAWIHGSLNAFGFATCGLLGARAWRVA